MSEAIQLNKPWLVAVWPGMGHVAMTAGYFLMAKLGMHVLAEFSSRELFDVEHVEVKGGVIRPGRLPRSRFFVWTNPNGPHDILVFCGEAQPPLGKYVFCRRLIEYAQSVGVQRVFTFAAMATEMHPAHESRVFGAATDTESLAELKQHDLRILEDGQISGLNGVLLGAASESGLHGTCLLGEIPQIFAQLPFPKASLAVLQVFTKMAGIEIDFAELSEQAQTMEKELGDVLARVESAIEQQEESEKEEQFDVGDLNEPALSPENQQRIEQLFEQAKQKRSKAYELKRELDRLGVFQEFEDRFLDLFKKPE